MSTHPSIGVGAPNVVFATVDSLRKDRVTSDTMPYLAGLREDGIWFDEMYSTAPATAASFVGLIASRYYSDVDGIGLPETEFSTLFEALPQYATLGYSTNQFTSSYYNYDRGLDRFSGTSKGLKFQIRKRLAEDGLVFQALEWAYHQYLELASSTSGDVPSYYNEPAESVNATVREWIAESPEPWLAWVHHMDPHHPYEPPADYLPEGVPDRGVAQRISRSLPGEVPADRAADLRRCRGLYDAECRYWDDTFRDFHQQLPEETLTVVVGDHGELLGEHGRLGHPHEMWQELVNVPCLIHHPDLPAASVTERQSTIDLAPTLLDLVSATPPSTMRGTPIDLDNPTASERVYGTIETPENVGMVRCDEWAWLRHNSRRSTQASPGELLFRASDEESVDRGQDVRRHHQDAARELRELFESELAAGATAEGRPADDQAVRKHLADLGYLEQE